MAGLTPFEVFSPATYSTSVEFSKLGTQLRHLAPPELQLDAKSRVIRRFVEQFGFSKAIIAIYNHWIKVVLPNQIKSRPIRVQGGQWKFDQIRVLKPTAQIGGDLVDLYPQIAQERSYDYRGEVRGVISFVPDSSLAFKSKGFKPKEITLFHVPVMLGSEACWLHGLTDDEKISRGECPNDPLGYFIIKGTPKVVTIQEKLRMFINLTFLDGDGRLETRMTCATPGGTTVTSIVVGKKWQTLKVGLQHLRRDHHLPLYIAYLVSIVDLPTMQAHLADPNSSSLLPGLYGNFTNSVLSFCRPEQSTQVYMALQSSLAKALAKGSFADVIGYIARKRDLPDRLSVHEQYELIYTDVQRDLFSHVPSFLKERHLASMAANTLKYLLNLRGTDDRDAWGNKRLDSAAKSMEQLFNGMWNNVTKEISASTNPESGNFNGTAISRDFVGAFQPSSWGVSGGYSRENITDTLKRDTPMAIYSQIGRINTPSARKTKQTAVRMIQPTQIGYCCLTGDTLILMADGVTHKPIADFTGVETILTYDPDNHRPVASQITNYFTKWSNRVFQVNTLLGTQVTATHDHPFLVLRDDDRGSAKIGWLATEQLKPGDRVLQRPALPIKWNAGAETGSRLIAARLLGYTWNQNVEELKFNPQQAAQYCDDVVELKFLRPTVEQFVLEFQGQAQVQARITLDDQFLQHLQTLGYTTTPHSPIPAWIMQGSLAVIREFMAGFLASVGVTLRVAPAMQQDIIFLNDVQYEVAPDQAPAVTHFVEQLMQLFHQLDIEATVTSKPSLDHLHGSRLVIRFNQATENLARMLLGVGRRYFSNSDELVPLAFLQHRTQASGKLLSYEQFRRQVLIHHEHLWVPVTVVTPAEPAMVYDFMTVESTHSLYANGIVTHNCIVETPEGENLGLLKNLALTTIISMERKPTEGMYAIIQGILDLHPGEDLAERIRRTSTPPDADFVTLVTRMYELQSTPHAQPYPFESYLSFWHQPGWIPVAIAGVYYFWTAPPEADAPKDILGRGRSTLEQIFLAYRRNRLLPHDACIFYNTTDHILEYFCEGGRPCRPLLIVEDGELAVDRLQLWDASCDELLERGCIEFVDAREQEFIMLAKQPEHVRARAHRISQLLIAVPQISERQLSALALARTALATYATDPEQVSRALSLTLQTYFLAVQKAGKRDFDLEDYTAGVQRAMAMYYRTIADRIFQTQLEGQDLNLPMVIEQAQNNAHRYALDAIDVHKRRYAIDVNKLPKVSVTQLIPVSFVPNVDLSELLQQVTDRMRQELAQLQQRIPYSHSEIDPVAILGIAGSLEPEPNCGQGPRATYQASMCKQALGFYHYNHHLRFDTSFKVMMNPSRPMFETLVGEPSGLNSAPTGTTPICAFMCMGDNNEDAIVVKQEFVERSNLDITKYITYRATISSKADNSRSGMSYTEVFGKPVAKPGEPDGRYAALNEQGFPKLDAFIRQGDAIVGKIRSQVGKPAVNASIFAGIGGGGYVDRVLVTWNASNEYVVKVKLRQVRKHVSGDKVSSRYAQKGTISRIVPEKQLPMIFGGRNHGLVPDFFLNAHSISSRMSCNMLKEMLSSVAALYTGERVDATAFHDFDGPGWARKMELLQMDKYGDVTMLKPDGHLLKKIFVAPCYYQCLRHHVRDKFQMRSRGAVKPLTHQPVGGKERQGGLRFGEMERDGMISHAASGLVLERLMRVSDAYKAPFCRTCGNLAIMDIKAKEFICRLCVAAKRPGTLTLTEDAQHRLVPDSSSIISQDQFVVKEIPYVLKLMFNMLQALGFNVTLKFKRFDAQLAHNPEAIQFLEALM
jgi:DNA-directed RNA polymerase beta subunit